MDILKTSMEITKTIKNVARLKEIVVVFAKNGFRQYIVDSELNKTIPDLAIPESDSEVVPDQGSWGRNVGIRLRKSFEELGPTFIKLGQQLSTREDIFDQGFLSEMRILLDSVAPIEFKDIKKEIPEEVLKNIESIEPEPIGMASIACVYKAKLKSGKDVVLKVRRPGIQKKVQTDISILKFLVAQLEKIGKDIKQLGLNRIVDDFEVGMFQELDFYLEALNCTKLKENITSIDDKGVFHFPHIYKEYLGENIIVMEYINGVKFSDYHKIKNRKEEFEKDLVYGVVLFMHALLKDGLFHADLHAGNFFLMDNGKIAIIDFGLMGFLSRGTRINLIIILYSLFKSDYENLVYELLDVADYNTVPNIDKLIRDIKNCLAPYLGLTVQETNVNYLFNQILKTLLAHELFLPREWIVIFRAIVTLDGVGKFIGIDFDIYNILEDKVGDLVSIYLNKEELQRESLWLGRSAVSFFKIVPRHVQWFFKEISKTNYSLELELKNNSKDLSYITKALKNLSFSIIGVCFFISGLYVIYNPITLKNLSQIPVLTVVFWLAGFFTMINALK